MSFQQNMLEALKISCKPARAIDGHTYYWYVDNDDARHVRAHFLVENGTTVVLACHDPGRLSAFRVFEAAELKMAVAWIVEMVKELESHKPKRERQHVD